MISKATLESIAQNIFEQLPPGLKQTRDDVKEAVRSAVNKAVSELDLVTQSEFESQIQKLDILKKRVQELESKFN